MTKSINYCDSYCKNSNCPYEERPCKYKDLCKLRKDIQNAYISGSEENKNIWIAERWENGIFVGVIVFNDKVKAENYKLDEETETIKIHIRFDNIR